MVKIIEKYTEQKNTQARQISNLHCSLGRTTLWSKLFLFLFIYLIFYLL